MGDRGVLKSQNAYFIVEMLTDSIMGNDHYLITVDECFNLEQ